MDASFGGGGSPDDVVDGILKRGFSPTCQVDGGIAAGELCSNV